MRWSCVSLQKAIMVCLAGVVGVLSSFSGDKGKMGDSLALELQGCAHGTWRPGKNLLRIFLLFFFLAAMLRLMADTLTNERISMANEVPLISTLGSLAQFQLRLALR